MKFDDFFIDQLRNSVNIVDIVQGYVRLVKKGQNYQALCPFHSEKTPSFSVSASKQIFKCFGCGASGDVFSFVSRIEGLSFPETVRLLAERNGMTIPEPASGSAPREKNRNRLLALMAAAAEYFRNALAEDPDALGFLRDSGLSDSTCRHFGLGYDNASDELQGRLRKLSYNGEELRQAGLDRKAEDRGEKAIVLPLADISGKILNFAYLPVGGEARERIGATDTALFAGGSGFFGLHQARQAMREKDYVILTGRAMEGMLLAQHGIANVVTCIGNGISGQQARSLGRNTKKAIINHTRGTVRGELLLRSVEPLLAEGFSINVVGMAGKKTLGTLLKEEGLSGYISGLKSSSPFFDYLLDLYLADAEGAKKEELLHRIRALLSAVPSRIARSEYEHRVAGKLGLSARELADLPAKGRAGAPADFSSAPDNESISRAVERDSFLNFTPDLRERIRAEFELTAVIRRFQKLEKRNLVYAGRCPFHPDGSSSLRVSKKRQIFKCLGCGAGGDVFSYISRFEEVSLPEAIVSLAAESGTSLTDMPGELARASDYRCRLLELMKSASLFFEDQLAGNPSALEYLQKRGISPETRNKFAFGFAPPGSLLMTEMAKQGYSLKELEAAGLIVRNDAGGYYDKFRNRIILSIRDLQGKIIAFGGRAFGDTLPKYLNSPETILYNKRNQLFGLSDAAQEIISQDLAVLVEGYFDCVVPSQFGIGNIVASLGTSLTEQQVSLLGGFTRNVIVSFDPDSAGREATARSINMFLSQGFSVRVMQLPEGMDPDQLIIEQGAGAYRQLLEKAVPFVDFMVGKHLLSSVRAMSPQGKQEIVTQVIPSLLLVPNQVERSRMAARLASLLKLDEKLILEEMRRFPRQPRPQDPSLAGNPMLEGITLSERLLLGALLDRDRCLPILEGVESRLFEGSGIKPVYDTILKLRKKNEIPSVPRVRDELDDAEKDVLEYWAVTEEALSIDRDNIANSVADLEGRLLKRRIREIQEEISRHESGEGDPVKLRDLLREKERLMRQTLP